MQFVIEPDSGLLDLRGQFPDRRRETPVLHARAARHHTFMRPTRTATTSPCFDIDQAGGGLIPPVCGSRRQPVRDQLCNAHLKRGVIASILFSIEKYHGKSAMAKTSSGGATTTKAKSAPPAPARKKAAGRGGLAEEGRRQRGGPDESRPAKRWRPHPGRPAAAKATAQPPEKGWAAKGHGAGESGRSKRPRPRSRPCARPPRRSSAPSRPSRRRKPPRRRPTARPTVPTPAARPRPHRHCTT